MTKLSILSILSKNIEMDKWTKWTKWTRQKNDDTMALANMRERCKMRRTRLG